MAAPIVNFVPDASRLGQSAAHGGAPLYGLPVDMDALEGWIVSA